tara:strand:- start:43 stop:288 length:246 start_codon:yes stop_codon:yes gene_type:complete
MAWATVTGSNGIWQYNNSATASDTYSDAKGTISSGVRSFTLPGGTEQKTYISCRKTDETSSGSGNDGLRGELSKTYFDAQS